MAIVRINDHLFYGDPGTRTLIERQLKNLVCLTADPTAPVKEYRFDDPRYGKDSLVNIKFIRKNNMLRIESIDPILEPEDNVATMPLADALEQKGVSLRDFSTLQSITEFLSAQAEVYGLKEFVWGSVSSFELEKHLSQPIKVNKVDAFYEGYQIYCTPNDERAPTEEMEDPTKQYVVLKGRARGNRFFSTNSSTRSDWYERLGEVDTENHARAVIANSYGS